MKSDRELLELAAKSIGGIYDHDTGCISFDGGLTWDQWNPFGDDSDCLGLVHERWIGRDFARRSIVGQAAAIGEKME